jgi:hypothetical protein
MEPFAKGSFRAGVSARYTAKSGVECGSLSVISASEELETGGWQ